MIRLQEVNTGEEIELDLNHIDIENPMERKWNILEGISELQDSLIIEAKRQFAQLGFNEDNFNVTLIKSVYHPAIGCVNL